MLLVSHPGDLVGVWEGKGWVQGTRGAGSCKHAPDLTIKSKPGHSQEKKGRNDNKNSNDSEGDLKQHPGKWSCSSQLSY